MSGSDRRPQSGEDHDRRRTGQAGHRRAGFLGPVAEGEYLVDMIIQNVSQASLTDLSFTVPRGDLKKAVPIIQAWRKTSEPSRSR